jgi:hypothetical protein
VQRELRPAVHLEQREVVHLADARHGDRGGMRALADPRVLERLDVDDHVAAGKRLLDRRLDGIGRRVPLAHAGSRGDADDDVRKLSPARMAHAQTPQHHLGELGDRGARGLFRIGRRAVHQHVDVAAREP